MKVWTIGLTLALAVAVLAGCGGGEATEAPADAGESESYTSAVLDTSYTDASNVSTQLVLGTIRLEETESAVTPEQAAALLPLWQALRGGVTAQAEVNAVLKQVEGTMSEEQLAAIAAMQLTFEDMGTWMGEQGVNFRPPQGAEGGHGAFANMSEEERVSMRAMRQAEGGGSGEGGGPGGFANMSDEEREALRATAEASGMTFGGRGGAHVDLVGRKGGGATDERDAARGRDVPDLPRCHLPPGPGAGQIPENERDEQAEEAQEKKASCSRCRPGPADAPRQPGRHAAPPAVALHEMSILRPGGTGLYSRRIRTNPPRPSYRGPPLKCPNISV